MINNAKFHIIPILAPHISFNRKIKNLVKMNQLKQFWTDFSLFYFKYFLLKIELIWLWIFKQTRYKKVGERKKIVYEKVGERKKLLEKERNCIKKRGGEKKNCLKK